MEQGYKRAIDSICLKLEEIQKKMIHEIKSELEKAEKQIMESLPELEGIFNELLQGIKKSIEEILPKEEKQEVITRET